MQELTEKGILSEDEILSLFPDRFLLETKHKRMIIRVLDTALNVFKCSEKAKEWFHRPNKDTDGKKPLELLRTKAGINILESLLGRIAYGIYF